ncbi:MULTISPECIES: sigma-70 family RNA polymerase sigma factor [Paraglaciecola]|jgi:RNA polymerase sigma-70 factor (ECF subfamily)|uniref:RNA polymerase sigma factor n=4 Tax=Paraglaciecola TaxID=1621534 RepID=A0A8H9IAS6_9ALTE|nr:MULTISPECIES: sigma-70 family RNA polymerase sigma factor [Paraglaciecola]AEE23616.1 RNA polymerase, sigma-24 subunit, ECF subfamily [Glaciecola sp. 4H-3-7+YE-5]MBN23985.1 RNA polymerase subunit sigma [Alteromonadaceae bacterium]MBJ2136166.1 sigma-70 family RNA polymerase sigma factor [Paraglaciecola chathamensis]MBU3016440.1 sigma-70 family RNA polymerase sigma factor [Paraglaciecola agarilytica]MDO6838365.1 sigma-70 family RNA polymerase sigma factor [Paraglaciecola chathamensis]|tara:strand:+ start:41622 stop:42179 length:558 start_codon:yes stop_codon:yes gene_type:complete
MNLRKQFKKASVSSDMLDKQKRYETLVQALHGDIFRYAYWLVKDKAVAEDIVQETFLRAWKSLDSLKDEKAAKSWLITILRRENARRFERKQFDLVDIDDVSISDDQLTHEVEIEHRELREIMASLSEEYREPLMLQIMFGYSGEEIAAQLDLNKNTVMTRLFRARSQIKEALEKSNDNRERKNG